MSDDFETTATATTCAFDPVEDTDVHTALRRDDPACSQTVWEEAEGPLCVWHADQADKPSEELAAVVENGTLVGARATVTDLRPVEFPSLPASISTARIFCV